LIQFHIKGGKKAAIRNDDILQPRLNQAVTVRATSMRPAVNVNLSNLAGFEAFFACNAMPQVIRSYFPHRDTSSTVL
jgi:hypothetical protein